MVLVSALPKTSTRSPDSALTRGPGVMIPDRFRGSAAATYQAWIDAYVSPGYAGAVAAVVAMVNAVALTADAATRERMHAQFRRSARYEWMLWYAAYRRQTWPLAGLP